MQIGEYHREFRRNRSTFDHIFNIRKILEMKWEYNNDVCQLFIDFEKPGNRSLGRTRRIWGDNIRMDLKEIGINTRNWVGSVLGGDYWRTLVNAALNLQVP